MRKSLLYNWWLSGSSNNQYVQSWLLRLDALGLTRPDATRIAALNAMFNSIGNTILTKIDILYIFSLNNASLQESSSINFINPSLNRASYVSSPNYATNGVAGNGTTSYVDTYNPSTNGVNYILNSASRFMYIESSPTVGVIYDGANAIANRNILFSSTGSVGMRINSSNSLNATVATTGTGYKSINRSSSTDVQYYNDSTRSDRTQTSTSIENTTQSLDKAGSSFGNTRFGLYGMGGSLTEAENTTIRTNFATFRTAIGL